MKSLYSELVLRQISVPDSGNSEQQQSFVGGRMADSIQTEPIMHRRRAVKIRTFFHSRN
jgi:hypothetical protein